jgi:hypothetical protein
MMYTDDYDYDWDEFFLMDLCMKLVLYFVGVIFSVLTLKVKFFSYFLSKSWLETLISSAPKRRLICN